MKNLLLNQLSQDDFNRLMPYLKTLPFEQHVVLFEAEQEIEHVYFPVSAVVSLVVDAQIGRDGRGRHGRLGRRRWRIGCA